MNIDLMVAMYGDPDGWSGLSASGAGPAHFKDGCPARLALPQSRTTGEAAERGNELHAFARAVGVNLGARAKALLDVPEKWRHTAEGMDIQAALADFRIVGYERAYALDAKKRSVRFIGENIDRDYDGALAKAGQPKLSRYEIPFTMDVEAFYEDTPVEQDYKSGLSIGEPSEHWQRRICAAGLMFLHDSPTAISRLLYIRDNGKIDPDGHEFTILEAEDFCDDMVRTIDAIWKARLQFANGIMPTVYPGETACSYCPAVTSCPYYTNFAKAMLGRLKAVEEGPETSTLTPEEMGRLWEELKHAEKIIEITLKGLREVVAIAPIQVGDKHEVRQLPRSRSYFNASKARGLIVRLLGRQGASDEEIAAEMSKLDGVTEYVECRKVKRLPLAS